MDYNNLADAQLNRSFEDYFSEKTCIACVRTNRKLVCFLYIEEYPAKKIKKTHIAVRCKSCYASSYVECPKTILEENEIAFLRLLHGL